MADRMRALTLRPHWAHAIAHLGKRVENRSRPFPPALIGERFAIHAGAERPGEPWLGQLRRAAPCGLNFAVNPVCGEPAVGPLREWTDDELWAYTIECRAIVATAVVRESHASWACRPTSGVAQSVAGPLEWADPGALFWWYLEDVEVLTEPVPVARGQLGLWRLDEETTAKVRAAEVAHG